MLARQLRIRDSRFAPPLLDLVVTSRSYPVCELTFHHGSFALIVFSLSMIRKALVKVDPAQLDRALTHWDGQYGNIDESLGIDGKSMCHAIDEKGRLCVRYRRNRRTGRAHFFPGWACPVWPKADCPPQCRLSAGGGLYQAAAARAMQTTVNDRKFRCATQNKRSAELSLTLSAIFRRYSSRSAGVKPSGILCAIP